MLEIFSRTRKSKTEAVLQRRSMLKLSVICKFMKRYGKCFMSWNVHLEFQVLCLGGVIFQVYWGCTRYRVLFAVSLVVYLNKHNLDNDVFVSWSWILLTHFCVAVVLILLHSRDQPPLKSTLFQLQVYANIRSLKISKWEMCFQLFLDLILDKDKYKLSLVFDALLGGLSIHVGQLRTCPVF